MFGRPCKPFLPTEVEPALGAGKIGLLRGEFRVRKIPLELVAGGVTEDSVDSTSVVSLLSLRLVDPAGSSSVLLPKSEGLLSRPSSAAAANRRLEAPRAAIRRATEGSYAAFSELLPAVCPSIFSVSFTGGRDESCVVGAAAETFGWFRLVVVDSLGAEDEADASDVSFSIGASAVTFAGFDCFLEA